MPRCFSGLPPRPLLGLLAILLSGCSAQPLHTAPNPFEIARDEYPRVFRATEEVLREQGFALDRHDYRFGRIDTQPQPAPTLFEPWRPTTTTGSQAITSTINCEQRIAIVTIEPTAPATQPSATQPAEAEPVPTTQPTTFMMRVEVQLQQLEVPARQLTGSTRGQRIQGLLSEAPYELRERGITNYYWRTVGRDTYLEQRLLAMIVRRSARVE